MVLQAMRERLSGIIAIFIFGILIIPFAFVGVNSYFTSSAKNNVAKVNDVDISANDFSQQFQNYRRRMQSMLGERFDPDKFDQPSIRRQFLDSMIDQELLTQASEQAGLAVDNETLAQAIREVPAFQVDGKFNPDVYQQRLQAQGTTPQQFENQMRAQLILNQFPGTITASGIATDWELKQFVRLQEQKRTFKAIVVAAESKDDPAGAGEIDDAAIEDWYKSHPQLYRSEEQVVIEYLELDASTMKEDVAPDDEELRARFKDQKARFVTPEARLASHILIAVDENADKAAVETARQKAESLAKRARAGEDFGALAKEYSQDAGSAPNGGDLGWIEPGYEVKAFEDALYALTKEHPISDPVRTGFGWHVIDLRDIRPAEGMTFEEARDTLLKEYRSEAQERKFIEQSDRLVDLIYEDPTTLNSAAEVLGLKIKQAGPFGRAGGKGIAANPAVVNAAFSDLVLQQGAVSDPVNLGENHIVVIRVKQHIPEALKPLAEVRDSVIASVRHGRAMKQASTRADEILKQVQDGSDMAAVAKAHSLELKVVDSAQRTSKELPASLISKVFQLRSPEGDKPVDSVVPMADGYAVVQLEKVVDGEVSDDDLAKVKSYRARISNSTASAEALAFIRMLRKQSEIEVFEDRL